MKTTVDIADELIAQARRIQKRDDVTLRSLIEDGLRAVIEKRAKPPKPYKWEPVVVGEPYRPGMEIVDVNAAIAEGYAHREARIEALLKSAVPTSKRKKTPPSGLRRRA
jgi:hypothetical protein